MTYLVADIGGTNTRIALADQSGVRLDTLRKFENALFSGFDDVLNRYLSTVAPPRIKAACLAVAGPVKKSDARLTNRNWTIKATDVQARLAVNKVIFINDLSALSYALPALSTTHLRGPKPHRWRGKVW